MHISTARREKSTTQQKMIILSTRNSSSISVSIQSCSHADALEWRDFAVYRRRRKVVEPKALRERVWPIVLCPHSSIATNKPVKLRAVRQLISVLIQLEMVAIA